MTFEATITWDRPKRNENSRLWAVDETPNHFFKRLIRILWSIMSKAAERSRSSWAVERPASSETKISFRTCRRTVLQQWNLRYADWKFDLSWREERCDKKRSAKTRSVSFDKNENSKWGGNSFNHLNQDLIILKVI